MLYTIHNARGQYWTGKRVETGKYQGALVWTDHADQAAMLTEAERDAGMADAMLPSSAYSQAHDGEPQP